MDMTTEVIRDFATEMKAHELCANMVRMSDEFSELDIDGMDMEAWGVIRDALNTLSQALESRIEQYAASLGFKEETV